MSAAPIYQQLWAKSDRKTGQTHPLICHLLDVAHVMLALWNEVLTDSMRAQFATTLQMDRDTTGQLLGFWAALHDLGKASPAFQRQVAAQERLLSDQGLNFPKVFSQEYSPHGIISAWALERLLQSETGLPPRPAKRIALALGGHHGAWPAPGATVRLKQDALGDSAWDDVRREILHVLIDVLQPPALTGWVTDRSDENTFITLFSGLTSVADWIGSMEEYFPYVSPPIDLVHYAEQAVIQAHAALTTLGWTGWQPPQTALRFEELFPAISHPNAMQEAIVDLAGKLSGPALVLIEAPTGTGKTEAALFLADTWAHAEQQRGLYVAMPTMATSNQMHGRVADALCLRYGSDAVKPLLVHSQARWMTEAPPPALTSDDEREGASTRSMAWFLPRKRSLLAPFGVGTVDQSLLSVLQTRHFFVRLFGLSHKTVIFDEVHAYDTYMSTLFQRLLTWLRAVDASVVLLSATLPEQTRRELVKAYAGDALDVPADYPAITWATSGQTGVIPLPITESRTLRLGWITRDADEIVARLAEALREGGCAAVICNTVARAQEVYRAVSAAALVGPEDVTLFHARTPFAWREQIEREVLSRFGKAGQRPHKAIVIATQVIEQSLDLDFDVMISDLAPVDLLLQRVGRLHRHARASRPAPLTVPLLWVAVDAGAEFPEFGNDAYVYEPYVLLRTSLTLQDRDHLTLPQDTAGLIGAVYSDGGDESLSPAWQEKLAAARRKMQRDDEEAVFDARNRLILPPNDERLLAGANADLEEDSPAINAAFQALTRLGEPGISLVCLHEVGGDLNTEPDGAGQRVVLTHMPDAELTGHLARHTVSVAHRGVFNHFQAQEPPQKWGKHPLLRDHRVVIFRDGLYTSPDTRYTLRLSREFGLEVLKE